MFLVATAAVYPRFQLMNLVKHDALQIFLRYSSVPLCGRVVKFAKEPAWKAMGSMQKLLLWVVVKKSRHQD